MDGSRLDRCIECRGKIIDGEKVLWLKDGVNEFPVHESKCWDKYRPFIEQEYEGAILGLCGVCTKPVRTSHNYEAGIFFPGGFDETDKHKTIPSKDNGIKFSFDHVDCWERFVKVNRYVEDAEEFFKEQVGILNPSRFD